MQHNKILIRQLGLQPYEPVSQAMHEFTDARDEDTLDEIWLVEHHPVFTQGIDDRLLQQRHQLPHAQLTALEVQQDVHHLLSRTVIGDLAAAIALDHRNIAGHQHVFRFAGLTLAEYSIESHPRADAPGVYVGERKICSLGLRIRKGCSFHGLALNIAMDLTPFLRINPCGYAGMEMTQMRQWQPAASPETVAPRLVANLLALLNHPPHEYLPRD